MSTIPIAWTFNYQVDGGPSGFLTGPTINVDAYDIVRIVVAAAGTGTLDLQPSKDVTFLAITSDTYTASSDPKLVTYTVDADATKRLLDGPHIFVGSGAVSFIGAKPGKLVVDNPLASPITVQAVVGRAA